MSFRGFRTIGQLRSLAFSKDTYNPIVGISHFSSSALGNETVANKPSTCITMKFISADEVKSVLSYKELIPALEAAVSMFSKKNKSEIVQPLRTIVPANEHSGWLGVMPAYCAPEQAMAVKLVSFYKENKDIPTHHSLVVVFNPENGVPEAIVDGDDITSMRTAAVSAIATKYLAQDNPKVLAILGAGVQARSHYHALSSIYSFEKVNLWSRTTANAKKCAEEIGAECCSTVEEAVKNADVIVTVTAATTPVLKADWVKPGAHINAVGACTPITQELDSALMHEAIVYVDSYEGGMGESGDIILSKAEIYAELGEAILGEKECFKNKTTIFESLGMAIEDVVSAKLVCDLLKRKD